MAKVYDEDGEWRKNKMKSAGEKNGIISERWRYEKKGKLKTKKQIGIKKIEMSVKAKRIVAGISAKDENIAKA